MNQSGTPHRTTNEPYDKCQRGRRNRVQDAVFYKEVHDRFFVKQCPILGVRRATRPPVGRDHDDLSEFLFAAQLTPKKRLGKSAI